MVPARVSLRVLLARLDRGPRARPAPRRVARRGCVPPRPFVPRRRRENGKYVSAVPITCRDDEIGSRAKLACATTTLVAGVSRARSGASRRALGGHLGARHASRSARPRRALVPPALPPRVSARPARPRTKPVEARGPPRRPEMADDGEDFTPCSAWTPGRRRRRYARRIARRRCAGTDKNPDDPRRAEVMFRRSRRRTRCSGTRRDAPSTTGSVDPRAILAGARTARGGRVHGAGATVARTRRRRLRRLRRRRVPPRPVRDLPRGVRRTRPVRG